MLGLALNHVSEEGHRMVIEDGNLSLFTKRKDLTSAIYMSNDNNTKIFLFVFLSNQHISGQYSLFRVTRTNGTGDG